MKRHNYTETASLGKHSSKELLLQHVGSSVCPDIINEDNPARIDEIKKLTNGY